MTIALAIECRSQSSNRLPSDQGMLEAVSDKSHQRVSLELLVLPSIEQYGVVR
jgi:hypothetical protein